MTEELERPPKPELFKIRWVCGTCMRVVRESLSISWVWSWDHTTARGKDSSRSVRSYWEPATVDGPRCHGREMLILGEPKIDVHGIHEYGLVVDPLDNMRCPSVKVA